MNNALWRQRKTCVVTALLLIALAVFAVGLIKLWLLKAKPRRRPSASAISH